MTNLATICQERIFDETDSLWVEHKIINEKWFMGLCFLTQYNNTIKTAEVELFLVFGSKLTLKQVKTNCTLDSYVSKGIIGFYEHIALCFLKDVEKLVNKYGKGKLKLINFIGHGFGGAIAETCTIYSALNNQLNNYKMSCTTFGSPCIGDHIYVNTCSNLGINTLHFEHSHDIICNINNNSKYGTIVKFPKLYWHKFSCMQKILHNSYHLSIADLRKNIK